MKFPAFDGKELIVEYKYEDNRVVQSIGGFMNVASGVSMSNLCFSTDVYDSIVYTNNSICVYTIPDVTYSFSVLDNPKKPTVYTLDSEGRLIQMVRRDNFVINYSYEGNKMIETNSAGRVMRNFYFENKNLIKITSGSVDTTDLYYQMKEILFQKFDTNPNPLKGMFYLSGSFYRAFSENNYTEYTVNEYERKNDGTIGISRCYWFSMPIIYNSDGYPMFGDYDL
jgi:hypothetical protein